MSAVGSLRTRLLVTVVSGVLALVLLTGGVAAHWVIGYLRVEFDQGLLDSAEALIPLTDQEGGEMESEIAGSPLPEFGREDRPDYFEIWTAGGTVFERSPSLRGADLPRRGVVEARPFFRDLALPDGRPGRLVEVSFVPARADEDELPGGTVDGFQDPASVDPASGRVVATLAVARGTDGLDRTIAHVRRSLLGVLLALGVGIALVVQVAVGRGFRPLEEAGRQIRDLDVGNLAGGIHLRGPVRELAPVVEQIDALLARLQEALEKERRFSSDVAHELRTPIAELRVLAEVTERWPGSVEDREGFVEEVGRIARRMDRVVKDLLAMGRMERGLERIETQPVPVADLVREVWSGFEGRAVSKEMSFRSRIGRDLVIVTDPAKLEAILQNLFSNAVSYGRAGTRVLVEASARDGRVDMSVANSVSDLEEGDLPRMFDRFWRKDPARTGGDHSGLGLALVEAYAGLLGFSVRADLRSSGVLIVTLTGPRDPREAG